VDVYFLKITKDLVTCVLRGVFDIVTWGADTTEFMVIDDSLELAIPLRLAGAQRS
jgi:hypothetical protein